MKNIVILGVLAVQISLGSFVQTTFAADRQKPICSLKNIGKFGLAYLATLGGASASFDAFSRDDANSVVNSIKNTDAQCWTEVMQGIENLNLSAGHRFTLVNNIHTLLGSLGTCSHVNQGTDGVLTQCKDPLSAGKCNWVSRTEVIDYCSDVDDCKSQMLREVTADVQGLDFSPADVGLAVNSIQKNYAGGSCQGADQICKNKVSGSYSVGPTFALVVVTTAAVLLDEMGQEGNKKAKEQSVKVVRKLEEILEERKDLD